MLHTYFESDVDGGSSGNERADIPQQYCWNLDELYPSVSAWKQHKDEIAGRLQDIVGYKGKLAENATTLLAALRLYFEIGKAFLKGFENFPPLLIR